MLYVPNFTRNLAILTLPYMYNLCAIVWLILTATSHTHAALLCLCEIHVLNVVDRSVVHSSRIFPSLRAANRRPTSAPINHYSQGG
ncbi:hypothetical protein M407DRAFT_205131 [Tulasnella calospora MUT 4182]|uniref:Uncharacterized protein n=1 Tax=Tulasnella calospora MUT 4182 TaxID=1051891 RepID=A0A0C3MHM5_9AGAM|nr:hypothetical protein M407DRAFT_205131 [Tulasnella calospora MUT 4182]